MLEMSGERGVLVLFSQTAAPQAGGGGGLEPARMRSEGVVAVSLDDLKTRARRLAEELMTQGDLAVADELLAPDCRHHAAQSLVPGAAGLQSWVASLRRAFPDLCVIVEDQIAEGDRVMQRLTLSGTHEGELFGMVPTDRRITWQLVEILRADADGRFVDRWSSWDQHGVLQQLSIGSDHRADWA
jgi:predicted ester cyclase